LCRWGRIAHPDIADRVDIAAIFGCKADIDIELAVSFQNLTRRRAAHCRLDDSVEVPRIETVARGLLAIHLDVEVGLAADPEDPEIGYTRNLTHLVQDLGPEPFEHQRGR
jgi:hypothetical protein